MLVCIARHIIGMLIVCQWSLYSFRDHADPNMGRYDVQLPHFGSSDFDSISVIWQQWEMYASGSMRWLQDKVYLDLYEEMSFMRCLPCSACSDGALLRETTTQPSGPCSTQA